MCRQTWQLCCLLSLRPFLFPMFSPDNRIRCAVLSFFFLQMKISHAKLTFRIFQPLKTKCLLNIVLTGSVHKAYVFDRKNNLFFPIRDNLHILCYMTSQRNASCSFTTFTPARWKACIAYDISNSRQAHAKVYAYAKIWEIYKEKGLGHGEGKMWEKLWKGEAREMMQRVHLSFR